MKIEEISPLQMSMGTLVFALLVSIFGALIFRDQYLPAVFAGFGLAAFWLYWIDRKSRAEINEIIEEADG